MNETTLDLALPSGRIRDGVVRLMADAGLRLSFQGRDYRPTCSVPWLRAKALKPQNVVEMIQAGSRDVGFTGADWVCELDGNLVELLDTGLDPVEIVAAAPENLDPLTLGRPVVVASEYERISKSWISSNGLEARFVRSFGSTEVFPPEDADIIVDNTATGATLRANGLRVLDRIMKSSTRLYASRACLADDRKRRLLDDFVLLIRSVLEGRSRVMIEVNVLASDLDAVVGVLPCMREPTISSLARGAGYAVKAAVARDVLTSVVPRIKEAGGTDIVVSTLAQIVP